MSSDIAIESRNLSKTYRKSLRPALSDVSLAIPKYRIFTLLGKNGAGKTTFLRIAATQLMPSSGTISVLGFDAVSQPKHIRKRIAAVPQEMRPFQSLTPYDHVMMSLASRGWRIGAARSRARETLEKLGLSQYSKTSTDDLSGGLRQRTLVAMALATEAELLFLDEPTIGLDPVARREVWREIVGLKREGKTIVLTTHYLDEAEAISDSIAIISEGSLLKVGSVPELKSSISETMRVDVASGFSEQELAPYGKVSRIGDVLRVLTDEQRANEITSLAIQRKTRANVSPISLDDVFIDLVGAEAEDKVRAENQQKNEDT
ncbi:MAG TPA: ABC transporter ATP-binding protein [Nitrososphaerales archaeon]|nr:ABC transporter ATP-binding protein [Nitrososphaerales archaeon]